MTQAQVQATRKLRRADNVLWLLQASRAIRKKITAKSGKWDAAKIIREIRYAK